MRSKRAPIVVVVVVVEHEGAKAVSPSLPPDPRCRPNNMIVCAGSFLGVRQTWLDGGRVVCPFASITRNVKREFVCSRTVPENVVDAPLAVAYTSVREDAVLRVTRRPVRRPRHNGSDHYRGHFGRHSSSFAKTRLCCCGC